MDSDSERLTKSASASAEVKSEIQEYLEVSQQRHKLFPRAAIVGLLAGSVAGLFRALLAGADALRNLLINWAQAAPTFGWIFRRGCVSQD